jgi:hypothetical protein
VELFLFGAAERYLEIELGPHGHYLALQLRGSRTVESLVADVVYPRPRVGAKRWQADASIPLAAVPPGCSHWNAHAAHGVGQARRYLSAYPASGSRPDFHRRDAAHPVDRALLAALARERS